jgi:hypothetical protein
MRLHSYEIGLKLDFTDENDKINTNNPHMQYNSGYINIYAITLDINAHNICNNPGSIYYNTIRSAINSSYSNMVFPFLCRNNQADNLNVQLVKFDILCLQSNEGSLKMMTDCQSKRLKYIIIKNNIFVIFYDDRFNTEIKAYMSDNNIKDINSSNLIMFTLYGLEKQIILDYVRSESENCKFNLIPFMGEINNIGYDKSLDIYNLLYKVKHMHTIGYSV